MTGGTNTRMEDPIEEAEEVEEEALDIIEDDAEDDCVLDQEGVEHMFKSKNQ